MHVTHKNTRTILFIITLLYFALLLKTILFKESWQVISTYNFDQYKRILLEASYQRANFTPFHTFYYYLSGQEKFETGLENLGGNILLFVPFGFLLPLLIKDAKCQKTLSFVVLASSFFEIMQFVIAFGNCDIDDILLNTMGGYLGYQIYYLLFYHFRYDQCKSTDYNRIALITLIFLGFC